MDLYVSRSALSDLLSASAPQVLSSESNTTGDEKMRAPARPFKEKVTVVSASKKATAWEVPPEMDARQLIAGHFCTSSLRCRKAKVYAESLAAL